MITKKDFSYSALILNVRDNMDKRMMKAKAKTRFRHLDPNQDRSFALLSSDDGEIIFLWREIEGVRIAPNKWQIERIPHEHDFAVIGIEDEMRKVGIEIIGDSHG